MRRRSCIQEYARYTSLNVLGMIGLSCYILADTYFVSKGLGGDGLAALNLAIPIYSFIHGSGLMLGMGGATHYAISRGQNNSKGANEMFTHTVLGALVLSVLFMLAGGFFSMPITVLLGADSEVAAMTNIYLKVILLFAPAFMMNDVLLCFVRNDGNPRLSMIAMLGGSLSNIVLDYLFIFPFQMGIFGAVLATGLAPVISILLLSGHVLKRRQGFRFKTGSFRPRCLLSIVSLGVPSLVAELSSGIVMITFNILILRLNGNVGVAAYGVIANLSLVLIAVYTGIAQGAQPLVSRAYGRGNKRQIAQILRYALVTMGVVSCLVYGLVFIFAGPIAGIFNEAGDMAFQNIAVCGLRVYFTAAPFVGFNIVISSFFTSTEKAVPAQLIAVIRGIILIVPMALILSALAGLAGVWLAFPVTEGAVCIVGIGYCVLKIRRRKQELSMIDG